jgi:hypothetical protein
MHDLAHQRCLNHPSREAVARCPQCQRYFCRECITEHQDMVLCARCLQEERKAFGAQVSRFDWLLRLMQVGIGFFIVYALFYYLAQLLLLLPTSFHEGTLWELGWWSRP